MLQTQALSERKLTKRQGGWQHGWLPADNTVAQLLKMFHSSSTTGAGTSVQECQTKIPRGKKGLSGEKGHRGTELGGLSSRDGGH